MGKLRKAALDEGLTTLGPWGVVGLVEEELTFYQIRNQCSEAFGIIPENAEGPY